MCQCLGQRTVHKAVAAVRIADHGEALVARPWFSFVVVIPVEDLPFVVAVENLIFVRQGEAAATVVAQGDYRGYAVIVRIPVNFRNNIAA